MAAYEPRSIDSQPLSNPMAKRCAPAALAGIPFPEHSLRLAIVMTSGAALLVTESAHVLANAELATASFLARAELTLVDGSEPTVAAHAEAPLGPPGTRRGSAREALQNTQYPLFKACRLLS
jgi:hypothetical protein